MPVKQEVNGTVIFPHLVFPATAFTLLPWLLLCLLPAAENNPPLRLMVTYVASQWS